MNYCHRYPLTLESLEDRLVPAFNAVYSPVTSTWTLTQVADNGAATVAVTVGNQLQIIEGASTITLGTAGANLSVQMLPGTNPLNVNLDTSLTGNLTVNLASGTRTLTLGGAANGVGGNLGVTAGTGDQTVQLSSVAALSVGGSANLDLGLGDDSMSATTGATIGDNLILNGVNHVIHAGNLTVGRNITMNVSGESTSSDFNIPGAISTGNTTVGGSFTYLGNSSSDEIKLNNGTTVIGGSFYANLGSNNDPAFVQEVRLEGATIGGSVTVLEGLNTNTSNLFLTSASTIIGGNIYVNDTSEGPLPGFTSGLATFLGTFGGQSITFLGGVGSDSVTYGMTGSRAHFYANLGAGADTFQLNATASLASLYVDFGTGPGDTFINNFGRPFNFPAVLRNL